MASVHTTIRELSKQISRRESKVAELGRIAYTNRWFYDSTLGKHRAPNDQERKQATVQINDVNAEVQPLRDALAALSDVIAKGLL